MVQVGRIHKRIDRCVPGGRQDIAGKRTGGVRQGFRQEKVLILAETIPGENPKPVIYSQTLLFKSK